MAFTYKHISGRKLTTNEENLLDLVDHLSWSIPNLSRLHSKINVEIHDRAIRSKTLAYDEEKLRNNDEQFRLEIEKHHREGGYYRREDDYDYCKNRIKEQSLSLSKRELEPFGTFNDKKVEISVERLGEYVKNSRTVRLYIDNITAVGLGDVEALLVSTYVHEMFHAYFDSNTYIEEIEEPIVECCMLEFLRKGDRQLKAQWSGYSQSLSIYEIACEHVRGKKFCCGLGHYGFGCFIHEMTRVNWQKLYKNVCNLNYNTTQDILKYIDYFGVSYPYTNEKDCANLLYKILCSFSKTKDHDLFKNLDPGCSEAPDNISPIAKDRWIYYHKVNPKWRYDSASQTLYLDGDWDVIDIERFCEENFRGSNNGMILYLGKDFYVQQGQFYSLVHYLYCRYHGIFPIYISDANKDKTHFLEIIKSLQQSSSI